MCTSLGLRRLLWYEERVAPFAARHDWTDIHLTAILLSTKVCYGHSRTIGGRYKHVGFRFFNFSQKILPPLISAFRVLHCPRSSVCRSNNPSFITPYSWSHKYLESFFPHYRVTSTKWTASSYFSINAWPQFLNDLRKKLIEIEFEDWRARSIAEGVSLTLPRVLERQHH